MAHHDLFAMSCLSEIKANIELMFARATDAQSKFNRSEFDQVLAELFYLRQYLDRADRAIEILGKQKIAELSKKKRRA